MKKGNQYNSGVLYKGKLHNLMEIAEMEGIKYHQIKRHYYIIKDIKKAIAKCKEWKGFKTYEFNGQQLRAHEIIAQVKNTEVANKDSLKGRLRKHGVDSLMLPMYSKKFSTSLRPVYALLQDGTEQSFDSIAQAAEKLNLVAANICLAAQGKIVHSGMIKFRYEGEQYNDKPILDKLQSAANARRVMLEKWDEINAGKQLGDLRQCSCCKEFKHKNLFYVSVYTTRTGTKNYTRKRRCIDCLKEKQGVQQPGIHKRTVDLLAQGLQRCCTCKEIKPLDDYCSNKSRKCGYNASCKQCMHPIHDNYIRKCKDVLNDTYMNVHILNNYGLPARLITPELRETVRIEILARREAKYITEFEGQTFESISALARYIEEKYGVLASRTEARMTRYNATPEECLISKFEYRSRGRLKYIIESVNQQTGEVKTFNRLDSCWKDLKVGKTSILESIRSGEPSRLYKTSKTKFTYKFKRYENRKSI